MTYHKYFFQGRWPWLPRADAARSVTHVKAGRMAFILARTLAMIAAMLSFVVAKIQIECIWRVDYVSTAVNDHAWTHLLWQPCANAIRS